MKLKFDIDFEGLKTYLLCLKRDDIQNDFNKTPLSLKLLEGKSIDDIDFFKMDKTKLNMSQVIWYGTPFLLDAIGNDLSICILSKKRYKLPTGRVIAAKFVATVIDDCHKVYGTALNGYWMIPRQFIKPK